MNTEQYHLDQLYVQTINQIKQQLQKQGLTTIRTLRKYFKTFDFQGRNKIEKDEFLIGLKEIKINLNSIQQQLVFQSFDINRDGFIDFDEFFVTLMGPLSEQRKEIIDKSFTKFSTNNYICIRNIRGNFNCSLHPSVQQGLKTEDQVFNEFILNFEDSSHDGLISYQEWLAYYHAVSNSIESEENFTRLMANTWQL